MQLDELYAGELHTAYFALDGSGQSEVRVLVDGCPVPDKRDFRKRVALLCTVGPRDMPSCDYVEGKVWKLTVSHHLRIYLFRDDRRLILTNGEWKTKRRDDPQSLVRAVEIRAAYFREFGREGTD